MNNSNNPNNSNNFNCYNNNYNTYNKFNYYNPNNAGGFYPNNGFDPNGGRELYYKQQAKTQRKQIRSLGNIIGCCIFIYIGVQVIASSILAANSSLYHKYETSSVFQDCFGTILVEFFALSIPFGLAALINKKKYSSALVPAKQMPASDLCLWVGAGMACCICANYVVSILSALAQAMGYEFTQPDSADISSAFGCLVAIIATAIVPAICEEFALRCCALGLLKKYGKAFGVVAVAIVFGLIHGNIIQFIFATIGGLIFGYVTVRTDSVVPAMLIHGLNNGMSVFCSILKYAVGENASNAALYALFGFWFVAGVICIVVLAVKKKLVFKLDSNDNTPYANSTMQKLGAFFSSPVLIISALYFVANVVLSIKKA